MEFKNFIKKINQIYNILFIILLLLCLGGIVIYYHLYKNNILFFNYTYSTITVFSLTAVVSFFVYFIVYIYRLIYNKIKILIIFKNNINDEIENEFNRIRFKKDKALITDNYLIVGAYILKIIKLEDINSIFLTTDVTHFDMLDQAKNLEIICKNNRHYRIDGYYAEEILKNIKKYIRAKNPKVSFDMTKKDEIIMDRGLIIFGISSAIIILILYFVLFYK